MTVTSIHFDLPPDVFRVGEALRSAGGRPFLVGGWVRDALLGDTGMQDYDVEVFGIPMERLPKVLRPMGSVHAVGRHFGVLKLKTREAAYDISVPRRESNIGKGHKAFLVETDPSMDFDAAAARRDFTINAMGYDFFAEELHDPWGGGEDLQNRLLRHVGPAFSEDPLRVLRALQFAGRFEMEIDPETLALCRTLDLGDLPRERLWEEIKKLLLQAPRPSRGLIFAESLGIFPYFPELSGIAHPTSSQEGSLSGGTLPSANLSPWEGTLAMLDHGAELRQGNEREDLVLMMAALCHRMDDFPESGGSASFLERLTHERQMLEGVAALLADLATPGAFFASKGEISQGQIRRLALRLSLPFLVRAATAQYRVHDRGVFEAGAWLKERALALGVWDGPPEPILKGRHLLQQGFQPGPKVGEWVRRAFEYQLDGGFDTLDGALAWIDAQLERPAGDASCAGRQGRAP